MPRWRDPTSAFARRSTDFLPNGERDEMNDEIARQLGFNDAAEFHRMVASVDLSDASKLAAFKRWQEDDGTKDGLAALGKEVKP